LKVALEMGKSWVGGRVGKWVGGWAVVCVSVSVNAVSSQARGSTRKNGSLVLKNHNMCDLCDVLHQNKYKNVVLHLHAHTQNTLENVAVANRLRAGAPTRSGGQVVW
jgi:hypothetical protein